MLKGKSILLMILGIIFVSVSGCATTSRKPALEAQGLKNQVTVLETRLKEKDQEIYDLKEALSKANEEKDADFKAAVSVQSGSRKYIHATPKAIQTGLKNANFYKGDVDGKIGKNTVEAIKEFQKANKLHIDGKVGKKTWALLKTYVN